jgi:hypothetical protein
MRKGNRVNLSLQLERAFYFAADAPTCSEPQRRADH